MEDWISQQQHTKKVDVYLKVTLRNPEEFEVFTQIVRVPFSRSKKRVFLKEGSWSWKMAGDWGAKEPKDKKKIKRLKDVNK